MLCLHGFTGTPFEVRPLCEAFAARGFAVVAPLLAGHGGSVDELACTRSADWLASAKAALDLLRDGVGGRRVGIVGFSLGGLLALRLARLFPDAIAALAVLAAPLRLPRGQALAVRALGGLRFIRTIPKLGGFDVTDPDMRSRNPALPALPVAGVVSLLDLAAQVRGDLATIKAPVLVAHGELDATVPPDNSRELARTIGSEVVEQLWLPRSGHLIGIDVERVRLADTIGRFFAEHLT